MAPPAPVSVEAPAVAAPTADDAAGRPVKAAESVRVPADRLDELMDRVGELVIAQSRLSQIAAAGADTALRAVSEDIGRLSGELRDTMMVLRMVPVASLFGRFRRLIHDLARDTGKTIVLVTEGEATEVDKTVIERLTDPITHMLRNAIDHGLETPEERVAAGKPAEGAVRLAALHRSGRIVIEISDDGRGINRERVKKIAVDKGLIAADAPLTDEQIDNLIFAPGFSTAAVVSDISGRGVGMDVVKRSIQALGGRISISSVPGKGSTFTLSLPLTLAVLDGMVVAAAEQTLIAPLPAIVESLTPQAIDLHFVGGVDPVIRFRDRFLPLIDVALIMGFREQPMNPTEGVAVVVETEGGQQAALLFDAIQGQRQVVIKSLETNYQQVEGVAAATILGDGRVALILDVDVLVTDMRRKSVRPDFKLAS